MSGDILREILERLAKIEAILKEDGVLSKVKDHERRLRTLEKFMWTILGIWGLWQGILTWLLIQALRSIGG